MSSVGEQLPHCTRAAPALHPRRTRAAPALRPRTAPPPRASVSTMRDSDIITEPINLIPHKKFSEAASRHNAAAVSHRRSEPRYQPDFSYILCEKDMGIVTGRPAERSPGKHLKLQVSSDRLALASHPAALRSAGKMRFQSYASTKQKY
ncbi:hypothetical protein O0L34_g5486 [Tuta absoluta]|nr:hypothetical protein O0L34_g5486 [Tuta absoluta]